MRALHLVVTRTRGEPVFAGSRVPVRALIDHLDRGRSLEAFWEAHPEIARDTVEQALALGLEALLKNVPLEPVQTQASLLPRQSDNGVILNAEELSAALVTGKQVRCPACRSLIFRSWPEGWDAHAATRCRGISGKEPAARKSEYKRRFGHLFRG